MLHVYENVFLNIGVYEIVSIETLFALPTIATVNSDDTVATRIATKSGRDVAELYQ